MNDTYAEALSRARAAVAALDDANADARATLLDRISDAQRATDIDPGLGATLARLLVDANGPRNAEDPVFAAFSALDETARSELAQSVRVLPQATAASLPAGSLPDGYLRLIQDYGVFVPTTPGTAPAAALRTVRADDGRVLVPAFLSRADLARWGGAEQTPAALVRLHDLLGMLSGLAVDGIVIDPGHTDSVVPTAISNARREAIPARTAISFGPAARLPDTVRRAAVAAASAIPRVTQVIAASVVDGVEARLVLVIGQDVDERPVIPEFARELRRELPAADSVDLLPLDSDLGRAIQRDVAPFYQLDTDSA